MVKHFRKEIPPEPAVWRQIWQCQPINVISSWHQQTIEQGSKHETYSAPQVWRTQDHPPTTEVEARASRVVKAINMRTSGRPRLSMDNRGIGNHRGEASWEFALESKTKTRGGRSRTENIERCVRIDKVSSVAKGQPVGLK